MLSFIFKGIMSNEFDTIEGTNIITVKQGRKQRPSEQVDVYQIPYRNEDLVIHSGRYMPYIQEFEFALQNPALISQINSWLSGKGKLYLENDYEQFNRDGFYIASVIDGWTYDHDIQGDDVYVFTVKFKVDPFFYHNSGETKKTFITQPIKLYNSGTIYSEPYIRINGSGNITLTINSQLITLTDIVDYIEIDSALMVAYKDTLNEGRKMSGEFPVLDVGLNNISWTGNVTSVEIKTRVRDLG